MIDNYQPPPQVYTSSQLSQFLNHIGLPTQFHNRKPSLSLLRALHTHFLSTFPYENLAIHYNPSHSISLDPKVLFEKAVTRKHGRGGYCMENALLFYHVLKGIGFDVYTVGARTRERDAGGVPGGEFPGWVHIINIVTLSNQRYHVDVAFGGDGPLHPLPLLPNLIHQNLGTQQIRLIHTWIPTQTHRTESSKLWIYQYCNLSTPSTASSSRFTNDTAATSPKSGEKTIGGDEESWNSYYCFSPETEFMAMDWEVVNHWTSTSVRSLQTHRPLCILFLRRRYTEVEKELRRGELRAERLRLKGAGGPQLSPQQEEKSGDMVLMNGISSVDVERKERRMKYTEQVKHGNDKKEEDGEDEEDDPGDFYIYGKRMLLAGTIKENLGGRTKIVEMCETEEQRVKALEKWFGITLTAEEKEGIRGFRSELKG